MKICLVASGGGHLKEITFLEPFYRNHKHFFVTFERPNTLFLIEKKVYFITDPKRNIFKLIKNSIQSIKIIKNEKPNLIITTGAGVAIPICYIGKIFGSKIVFIESFCRTKKPSLSGKILYPISDLFIIQWKRLKKYFPRAIYGGTLI
ncbi:MAG: PssD/Cps14F family polysaccharide biosynthesis glycosyltransferase [Candidatus Aenigmatarchaeota archaeon]